MKKKTNVSVNILYKENVILSEFNSKPHQKNKENKLLNYLTILTTVWKFIDFENFIENFILVNRFDISTYSIVVELTDANNQIFDQLITYFMKLILDRKKHKKWCYTTCTFKLWRMRDVKLRSWKMLFKNQQNSIFFRTK